MSLQLHITQSDRSAEIRVARKAPQLAKLTRPRLHKAVACERMFAVLDEAREHKPCVRAETSFTRNWIGDKQRNPFILPLLKRSGIVTANLGTGRGYSVLEMVKAFSAQSVEPREK